MTNEQTPLWFKTVRRVVPVFFVAISIWALAVLGRQESWESGAVPPLLPDRVLAVILMFLGGAPQGLKAVPGSEFRWLQLIGIVLTLGTVLQLVLAVFSRVVEAASVALFCRGHVVICGLSRKGLHLAQACRRGGRRVLVIEVSSDHPDLDRLRSAGVRVLIGDATSPKVLRSAGVNKAANVLCLCDDRTNLEIMHAVDELAATAGRRPACHIHIGNRPLYVALQRHEFETRGPAKPRKVRFFNLSSWGAARLLEWRPEDDPDFPVLFGREEESPSLIIVGAGAMGQAFVVGFARRWCSASQPGAPLPRITLVDRKASTHLEELLHFYPWLTSCTQIRAEEMEVTSLQFLKGGFLRDDEEAPDVIYVFLSDDVAALVASLDLLGVLQERQWDRTRIVMRVAEDAGLMLSDPVQKNDTKFRRLLKPFRITQEIMDMNFLNQPPVEQVAIALCHSQLHAQAAAASGSAKGEVRVPGEWDELSPENRESHLAQASSIRGALAALTPPRHIVEDCDGDDPLTEEEIELLARREHHRWMHERLRRGWRPGAPSDANQHIHPDLLPWDQLPEPIKEADRALIRSWAAALKEAGLAMAYEKGS